MATKPLQVMDLNSLSYLYTKLDNKIVEHTESSKAELDSALASTKAELDSTLASTKTQLETTIANANTELSSTLENANTELNSKIQNVDTELGSALSNVNSALERVNSSLATMESDYLKKSDASATYATKDELQNKILYGTSVPSSLAEGQLYLVYE